jgi:GST-like protein
MTSYRLFGRRGWGFAIVEAQLTALDVSFDFEEVPDLFTSDAGRQARARHNPLAQIPTLALPDGSVMTESAAITLHLADATDRDDFVPSPGDPARPQFLRWLVFLVAKLYPTFTYADDTGRFVKDEAAAQAFRGAVDEYRQRLWHIVDDAAGATWFLGNRFSALDICAAVMTRWRPGRAWFNAQMPKLVGTARRTDHEARLLPVWLRNFNEDFAA